MARVFSNRISEYSHENGGRVMLLFLLFLLAIYEFITAGFSSFAIICLSPLLVLFVYWAFKWKMFTFWILVLVNYLIQMKDISESLPLPMSIPNELLQISLLAIAIVDARENPRFEKAANLMLFSTILWCTFCTIEIFNDTCNLGIDFGGWYSGARMMAFQLLYIILVFSIYISTPKTLNMYLILWGVLALFSVFWVWKQEVIGFTNVEKMWMETRGRTTHIINAGTLIRYFSTFSDAANYGCNAAATAAAFIIFTITTKLKKFRIFYFIVSILVIWGMLQSGTRTAIFCLAAGLLIFVFLSKSAKLAVPFAIAFVFFAFILVFTNIGDSNQQIHRMRSAFNKNDASANVRDINKAAISKYLADAPWGLGLSASYDNIPANNKYNKLSTIPPDSDYVFIWVHTGKIGIIVFVLTTILMFLGACYIVLFKLNNRSIMGIGTGFCAAFISIQLGGYANQVLMQFPNCLMFYGGLAIVYILPFIEPEWVEYENKMIAQQEEKKRLKLEKKLASRV